MMPAPYYFMTGFMFVLSGLFVASSLYLGRQEGSDRMGLGSSWVFAAICGGLALWASLSW